MNGIKNMGVLILALCAIFFSSCGLDDLESYETDSLLTEKGESIETSTVDLLFPEYINKYYNEEFDLEKIPDDLLQVFTESISSEELQIINNAWIDAPSEAIRGAEAHIYVLLRALQKRGNTDIEITSAKIVPYAIDERDIEMEAAFGCDSYALQITDNSGNIYLVWDGFVYEEVICNGETVYSRYHIVF